MDKSQNNHKHPTFSFTIGGKSLALDYPRAFALGDQLLQSGHVKTARAIFESIGKTPHRGPRAQIMLALCQARLNEFAMLSRPLASNSRKTPAVVASTCGGGKPRKCGISRSIRASARGLRSPIT